MRKLSFLLIFMLVGAGGVIVYQSFATGSSERHSVEMSVSRMSCGSCVETIRGAVTALDGAINVNTDVAAARSIVEYQPQKIAADQIAAAITASGYPATILYVRNSAGEVQSGIDIDKYVARIGSRLVERDTFNYHLSERMDIAETAGKPVALKTACQDAWRSILQQELLLNAADQFGVTVNEEDLNRKLAESAEADKEETLNELKISGYFDLQYPDREPNTLEINNLLNSLYTKTVVDIFDDKLKQQLSTGKSGSGCGGACCG